MKLILSILILLISIERIYCQEPTTNLRINVGNIIHTFYLNGLLFKPVNQLSNQSDSIGCKNQEEEFYLNGLQINMEQFMELNLSHKDLSNDSTTIFNRRSKVGYGTYEYHFQKGRDCSSRITYRMEVKLPFFVNGKEINQESQSQKLSGIEILTIERKNSFLGTDEIHIKAK